MAVLVDIGQLTTLGRVYGFAPLGDDSKGLRCENFVFHCPVTMLALLNRVKVALYRRMCVLPPHYSAKEQGKHVELTVSA